MKATLHRVALLVLLLLVGCTPLALSEQKLSSTTTASTKPLLLHAGDSVGQTFVAYYAGLEGLDVFLQPDTPGSGTLTLTLHATATSTATLTYASLPIASIDAPAFHRFAFAPLATSRQQYYYARLELTGSGTVAILPAPADAYQDGTLYHNSNPLDANLRFRPLFHTSTLLMGLLRYDLLTWSAVLVLAALLYLLPGWALLVLLWRGPALDWPTQAALAVGVSLALYPLLLLWTDMIGLHLGAGYGWGPLLLATAVLLWHYRPWQLARLRAAWQRWRRSENCWPDGALLLVLAAVFVARFLVLLRLDAPLWLDSFHHTLITALIVQNGGLFRSWQPYADMQSLTYHFGFHTGAALFQWLGGLAPHRATLWTGQVLNGLAVFALYPLAVRLGRNRWAGVSAVLLAGLLAPMPMSYLNWGRYTQLAGQVILPAALYIIWTLLEQRPRPWPLLVLGTLVLGGLALTHYRVLIFAGLFLPACWLLLWRRVGWQSLLISSALLLLGAGGLALPWLAGLLGSHILRIIGGIVAASVSSAPEQVAQVEALNRINELGQFLPYPVWLLLVLSPGWGLWRRERGVLLVAVWCVLLVLSVNPDWLGLPGKGALTNFALVIAAYIPAGILIGAAVGWLLGQLHSRALPAVLLVLLVLTLGGAVWRLDDLDTARHEMVTRPDMRAATWVATHTPPDARFLVNSFFPHSNLLAGTDGGWWLPVLAGRQTIVPPLSYASEQGPRAEYKAWVHLPLIELHDHGLADAAVRQRLAERGVTHIYLGQRRGRIWHNGTNALQPAELLASPYARLIYHEDHVWIFELVQQ